MFPYYLSMFPVVTEDISKCLKITQDCSNVGFFLRM